MKKLIIILPILILGLSACKRDLSYLNVDSKRASIAPSYTLFSNAERNLVDILATPNVNINIFQLITQQWTEVTYVDESNYDIGTRSISDSWWRGMYKNVLINFEASRKLIPSDVIDPIQQKNELAMLDIMEVLTWSTLVNTYGDIPYKEALNPSNLFPKYDNGKTVYYDLLSRLDVDIANLNVAGAGFASNQEIIYGGNVAKWKMFANSLKLRLGLIIADSDAGKAQAIIESAAPNVFKSNTDNASFAYSTITPNTNPVWVNLVQSGRNDYVPSKTIIGIMNANTDPRLPFYFTQLNGAYVGGTVGAGNAFPSNSHPSDKVEMADAPYVVMSYAEVEFALAESIERGFNVGGSAAVHYTNGVKASLAFQGVLPDDAGTYLSKPSVAYATAEGTYKQKIGIQKYLALYMDGFDAWTEQRRLDYPMLVAPPTATSGYPVRYTYPVNEQNLNSVNWKSASTAIGGDKVETKLFWDKF